MSRNPNLRESYLEGEKLFRKYISDGETRSVESLTEWAIVEGMKSSKGVKPTCMGIWKAAFRWASTHKEQAWELMKGQVFGSKKKKFTYSKQEWEKDMIEIKIPSAWQHTTNVKYQKFLRENGWR